MTDTEPTQPFMDAEDKKLDLRLVRCVLFSAILITFSGNFVFDYTTEMVLIGSVIFSLVLFFSSRYLIKKLIFEKKKSLFIFLLIIKMSLTGIFIFLTVYFLRPFAVGLVAGFSVIPLSLFCLIFMQLIFSKK